MKDKPIPKYQIREKTPEEQLDTIPSAKLLKKIKEERIKLNREKDDWERVISKFEGYHENIQDLEKKRKEKELQVRDLQNQHEKLKNKLGNMRNEIKQSKNNLYAKERELDQKNADLERYQERLSFSLAKLLASFLKSIKLFSNFSIVLSNAFSLRSIPGNLVLISLILSIALSFSFSTYFFSVSNSSFTLSNLSLYRSKSAFF